MARALGAPRKVPHVSIPLYHWRRMRQELADVHRAAGTPWSDELAGADMRALEWDWCSGGREPPGRRCLAEDWGWTTYRVRLFLDPKRGCRWRDDALRTALADKAARDEAA